MNVKHRKSGESLGEFCIESEADLRWANLRGADLSGANLRGAKGKFSTFNGGKHDAVACGGFVSIGCEFHLLEWWIENFNKVGETGGYSMAEIERYGSWLKTCQWTAVDDE